MIVKGELHQLGPGIQTSEFQGYRFIKFHDGTEVMVSQSDLINIPQYLGGKLSEALGKEVAISMTDNKKLILAVRYDGKTYKIDKLTGAMRGLDRGFFSFKWFLMSGLLGLCFVFPPSILVWYILRTIETNKLNRQLNALE